MPSGYVFAFLNEAHDPEVIVPGAIVVAEGPVFPRVVDLTGRGRGRLVHVDVAPVAPRDYLPAAARAHVPAPRAAG